LTSERVNAPALIVLAQAGEHGERAHVHRGDGQGVVEPRADVGQAHLEGGEAGADPHVPPQLRCVLDQVGLDHGAHEPLIFGVAIEGIGQARARQAVEDRQAV